jgi:predicted dehydrogenase
VRSLKIKKNVIKSDVMIIFICTLHYLLSKIAIECLKNKKHIFIEKPGTINRLELNKIKLILKRDNLKAKKEFNHRYHPRIILSKKIIEQNKLGKILFLKGSYGHGGRKNYNKEWRFDIKKSGGGELIDQGSHLINDNEKISN